MTGGKDIGFCIAYHKLSYRRKLVRSLWLMALCIPIAICAAIFSPAGQSEHRWGIVVALVFLGCTQAGYSFYRWHVETKENPLGPSVVPSQVQRTVMSAAQIKRGLFGAGQYIVAYNCGHCAASLKSPLDDVGTTDACPACGETFIVPGTAERDRFHNERIEKDEAKSISVEAKHTAKRNSGSAESFPPQQTDPSASPPFSSPKRTRYITAVAVAASSAIVAGIGLAFHLGQQSVVRSTAVPQSRVWDPGVWEKPKVTIATQIREQTVSSDSPNTQNLRENGPAGSAKGAARHDPPNTRHIIATAEESVVMLEVRNRDEAMEATGSGFVFRQGVIVTNYHVIEDAERVLVKFENGRDVYSDGYLAADKVNDLALVKCDTGTVTPLPLGDMPDKLDPVYAIGSPRGVSGTISNGIVSGLVERKRTGTKMIQTTAAISHGSSGGPLLNEKGEVIGIMTESLTDSQNMNFAVATIHVATLETVAHNVAHPWRELPTSTAATLRGNRRDLVKRIEQLNPQVVAAKADSADMEREYAIACRDVNNTADHLTAAQRLGSSNQYQESYQSFLDAVNKRNDMSPKVKEARTRLEELNSKLNAMRKEYEELGASDSDE